MNLQELHKALEESGLVVTPVYDIPLGNCSLFVTYIGSLVPIAKLMNQENEGWVSRYISGYYSNGGTITDLVFGNESRAKQTGLPLDLSPVKLIVSRMRRLARHQILGSGRTDGK